MPRNANAYTEKTTEKNAIVFARCTVALLYVRYFSSASGPDSVVQAACFCAVVPTCADAKTETKHPKRSGDHVAALVQREMNTRYVTNLKGS